MTALEKLGRRLPDASDEELLNDLLAQAGAFIRSYTHRDAVPDALEDAQVELAAVLFNRMGMEGESSHSEGGVSRATEGLPEGLRRWLNAWRLAKTV